MRYPTMTRVFAAFLVLCSLMLIGAGGFGIYKTMERKQEQELRLSTIEDKAEQYMELNLQLAGKSSYKAEKAKLEGRTEDFEDASSRHRRDLTEYTAKKGGIKMGTDALDQADLMFKEGKAQFQQALSEFEQQEAEFYAGYQQYQAGVQALAQARQAYNNSMNALNVTKETLASMDGLQELYDCEDPVQRLSISIAACDNALAALDNAEAAIKDMKSQGNLSPEQVQLIDQEIVKAVGMSGPELRAKIQAARDRAAASDPAVGMNEEEYSAFRAEYQQYRLLLLAYSGAAKAVVAQLEPVLELTDQKLTAGEEELNKMAPMMEEGKKGIEQGRAMMDKTAAALEQAEDELYKNRTYIWYELGQLEEQFQQLQKEKAQLEGDSEELERLEKLTEERKKLESRRTGLSLDLRDEKRIRELYENDTELYEAAGIFAKELRAEIDREFGLEIGAELLMIITGILGFMTLPGVCGKEKSRKLRLMMPLVVAGFAAFTLILGLSTGLGLFKAVLVVLCSDGALILSAIPNRKKKDIPEEV